MCGPYLHGGCTVIPQEARQGAHAPAAPDECAAGRICRQVAQGLCCILNSTGGLQGVQQLQEGGNCPCFQDRTEQDIVTQQRQRMRGGAHMCET